ncbi:MAG: ferrochelatase [Proteobacteria bacterium]|nr:ferrochelatase [Pseudomonadota bacterium]
MSSLKARKGLLLVNLGTPDSPSVADVRRYLRQFLWDPRVIDRPAWQRWLILNLLILPRRPRRSAAAYAKIWTAEGSPLLAHSRALTRAVQTRLGDEVSVALGMRYGNPSIASALAQLRAAGADRVVVLPLYPQYSSAATGSSVEAVMRAAASDWNTSWLHIVPPFYEHPSFIAAFAAGARPVLEAARPQRVLFSFHGLPERHCCKSDVSGQHCLAHADCCTTIGSSNRYCYRAQCFATMRALGAALDIAEEARVICFQSRLGREAWIRPYTDQILAELPRQGIERVVVLTPAFVADCLETVEEIGMRGVEAFRAAGGRELVLAPCPNASAAWADAVVRIAREDCGGL